MTDLFISVQHTGKDCPPCHKKGYANSPPLIMAHLNIKDTQCAEANEKSYFTDI